MKSTNNLSALALFVTFSFFAATATTAQVIYPETMRGNITDTFFGTQVPDPYRWLEDDLSQDTKSWITAQNEITFGYLDAIPFRDAIADRLTELWNYERQSAPFKRGDFYYYYRNDGLQNHSVLYRTRDLSSGEEEIFLNPNIFSDDGTTSLAGLSFSEDASLVAYAISIGGSDWRNVIFVNTATKEIFGETLTNVKFSGISWLRNEGIFYSSYEQPDGSALSAMTDQHKLYFHRVGTSQSDDELIFGGSETPRRYIFGGVTEDHRYLVISAAESTSGNELYIKDLSDWNSGIQPVVTGVDNTHSIVDIVGDRMLVYTNHEAPNYRLVEVPVGATTKENWKDVIPGSEHVLSVSTAGGSLFASYLIDVQTVVRQFDYDGNFIREVGLPSIGTASGFSAYRDEAHLYYSFTSFTYPSAIYRYAIETGASELYWRPQIDFDPEAYVTEQVFYESNDGTRVPMFITYKKGLDRDGTNPTYLYGYGGFNVSLRPSFSISRLVWLENGGIYAQPNIRGGGEYGRAWHMAGTKMNRQNVFDDFIAAAEYLIEQKYTSAEKLAIAGGSNGGLLVAAAMLQRPDLFAVALPAVGVLDMLRYHTFTAGAGWAFDYGTAEESEEMFRYLRGYSPVHNVANGVAYPATLITTGDHDDRVVPAHSYKYAAALQYGHRGNQPVMIRIETLAGHGAGKPTSMIIRELADIYAFTWKNMGYEPFLR
jgi:prolyl oligopeptidase